MAAELLACMLTADDADEGDAAEDWAIDADEADPAEIAADDADARCIARRVRRRPLARY